MKQDFELKNEKIRDDFLRLRTGRSRSGVGLMYSSTTKHAKVTKEAS